MAVIPMTDNFFEHIRDQMQHKSGKYSRVSGSAGGIDRGVIIALIFMDYRFYRKPCKESFPVLQD